MDNSFHSMQQVKSSQMTRSSNKRLSLKFNLNVCTLQQYIDYPEYPAFLQTLNTIISSNTTHTFTFERNDILLFLNQLNTIHNESIYDVIRFIKYINKSQCKLSNRVLNKCKPCSLIQVILSVVSLMHMPFICKGNIIEFSDKKNVFVLQNSLNEFIIKLFESELISLKEAEMIVQSIYLINEYHHPKANIKHINNKVYDTKSFLCSFNLYFLFLQKISYIINNNTTPTTNTISNEDKNNFAVSYIRFIMAQIKGDLNYIYYLSSTQNTFKLLNEMHNYQESKDEMISFLKYIYNNRFKQKHLAMIYKSLKHEIVNINKIQDNKFISSLKLISSQVELFNELIKQNTIHIKSFIQIDSGFIFHNSNESLVDKMGFDYSPVNLGNEKRSLCLFITFQAFETTSDLYKPIFLLNDLSRSKDLFIVYQYRDCIYFKLLDHGSKSSSTITEIDYSFNIESDNVIGSKIQAMKDMFLVINYNNPRIGKSHFTCYLNNMSSKKDIQTGITFESTNAIKFKIGYYVNDKKQMFCFNGIIGAVEVFACDIDKKFCDNLERNFLVYRYFINNDHEKQSDVEFDNYYSCSLKERPDMEFINKVCNQSKLKEKLITVISPNVVFNRFNKDKSEISNHTYYNNLNYYAKFEFKTVPEPENGGVFVFTDDCYFFDVFTKNEGIDYIVFCFEYMYSVFNGNSNQIDLMKCIEQT